jgi:hypothetical protein
MAIAHAADGVTFGQGGPVAAIQHNEVVAGAVHFAEPQGHYGVASASAGVSSGFTNGPLLPQAETNRHKAMAANTIFMEYLLIQKV